ncbi:MAG: ABC transporter permease [Bauldia sp.]|nr:ABC transporter permease [Bauldia sp.]
MSNGTRVLKALRRSTLQAIPTLGVILVLNFFLLRLAPGDAAEVMAGEQGVATEESMAAMRKLFGLDIPVLDQFVAYINNLLHFSLGYSPRYGMQVEDLIAQRLPGSILLMGVALVFALGIGIFIGTVMARYVGRLPDRILSVVSLVFYSVPGFWIGLMMVVLFSVTLGWLPSGSDQTIGADYSGLEWLWDRVSHLILPALSLSLVFIAIYARLTRASMLESQGQDYVRTAAAKGLSPRAITFRHVLRNALLPVTTMAGLHFGTLLGGAVVVETVFSWPGLGRLAFESIMRRDFNVLLGILLLSSILVMIANVITDLVQAWLDPRIEVR